MAQQLSKAVGKLIRSVDLPPAAMREALLGFGMLAWQADSLVEDYDHYCRGEASAVTTTVRDLTGKRSHELFSICERLCELLRREGRRTA